MKLSRFLQMLGVLALGLLLGSIARPAPTRQEIKQFLESGNP